MPRLGRSQPFRPKIGRLASGLPAYSLTAPTPNSGLVGVASGNFTVTPNGIVTAVITPSDSGGGGTFTPTSLTFTASSSPQTFTYTPASASVFTISCTNSGSLINPASVSYTGNSVSGTITVTNPTDFHGYWSNGSGLGNIPISGTWTDGPSGSQTIKARFNGGSYAVIATVTAGTGTSGSFSGTLSNQARGQGTLDVCFTNATGINDSVASVSIGVVIGIAGQSNAIGVTDNLHSYSNGSGLKVVCFKGGNTSYTAPGVWGDGNDPYAISWTQGSPWPLLGTRLLAYLGYPVIFIETAIGGRSLIWYWTKYRPTDGQAGTGGSPSILTGYGEIAYSISAAATGGVDAIIWYQGEQDATNLQPRHVYAQALGTFSDQIDADVTNGPPLACVQIGHDGHEDPTPAANYDAIKLGISDAVRSGGNFLDGMVVISDFNDNLHILTDADSQKVADRMAALLISELLGGTPGNGRGPRIVGLQHNTARTVVTYVFDKPVKTGRTHDTSLFGVKGNGVSSTVTSITYNADPYALDANLSAAATLPITGNLAQGGSTAGKVWPVGPDNTDVPGVTQNLPAEPFSDMPAALAEGSGSVVGSGGPVVFGF